MANVSGNRRRHAPVAELLCLAPLAVLRSKQVRDKFRKSTVEFFQASRPQGLAPDQKRLADLLFVALVNTEHKTQ